MAALAGTAALPLPAIGAAARAAPAAIPPTAYAWAHLIVRAQNKASPATLARHLRLGPDAASALFDRLVADGVLRAPGAAGIARAVSPIDISAKPPTPARAAVRKLADALSRSDPLVKAEDIGVGCGNQNDSREDQANESADQPPEESPERG